ncbi:MAG TPA: OB-fold domain-containing protein, partial [Syntrophales bacterium]|nr:OB-fold domain-containing protein [Syntrophales bacterium]
DMEWCEVTGPGTLQTFTSLSYAPAGFGQDLPYMIAIADFGSLKVFGRMDSAIPGERIRIGMPLRLSVQEVDDAHIIYMFKEQS